MNSPRLGDTVQDRLRHMDERLDAFLRHEGQLVAVEHARQVCAACVRPASDTRRETLGALMAAGKAAQERRDVVIHRVFE